MRIWTLHPKCLDTKGLLAVWREALLAQAVLRGRTRGYRHHPQLERFRGQSSPLGSLAEYLLAVCAEADDRGYRFERARISRARCGEPIPVTTGQLAYEWDHLLRKLRTRDPQRFARLSRSRPTPHPIFRLVPGPIEAWERT
jgi:hypothetical protein